MDARTQIGRLLVEQEVVTPAQWAEAAAAGPRLADAVALLQAAPAWWSPPGTDEPALSAYQAKLVLAGKPMDRLAARLRVDRYLILGELGRGGMGVVLKALDRTTNRLLAVKRVKHPTAAARRRFHQEAEALARFDHPGICRFLGVDQVNGVDLLLCEYLPGQSLARAARRAVKAGRPLPWPDVARWAVDLLDALEHLHGRRVIHRDVKPGNVMLTGDRPRAVLLDLGLARLTDGPADHRLTTAGQMLGTQDYMPPEQWAGGDRAVPGSDLYALGGSLFCALSGRPPFPGDSVYDQCHRHLTEPPPSVLAFRSDVPAGLDAVLRRMLAKTPADRGTARELRGAFQRLLASAAARSAADPAPEPRFVQLTVAPSDAPTWVPSEDGPEPTGAGTGSLLRELAAEVRTAATASLGGHKGAAGAARGRAWAVAKELLGGRRLRRWAWAGAGLAVTAAVPAGWLLAAP